MACKYINDCPSASGWCEGPRQDYERCVQFLISACGRRDEELEQAEGKLEKIRKILRR